MWKKLKGVEKMKFYRARTEEEYDWLMQELDIKDPTFVNKTFGFLKEGRYTRPEHVEERTNILKAYGILVYSERGMKIADISFAEEDHPEEPIIEVSDLMESNALERILSDEHFTLTNEAKTDSVVTDKASLKETLALTPHKPEIPEVVADWIEDAKYYNLLEEIDKLEDSLTSQNMKKERFILFWIKKNTHALFRAYLDDYVIEQPTYYAKIKLAMMSNWANDEEDYFHTFDDSSTEVWLDREQVALPKTKEQWAKSGINDTNAVFLKPEEVES